MVFGLIFSALADTQTTSASVRRKQLGAREISHNSSNFLTADAAELDGAAVEPFSDGELAPLVECQAGEVQILHVHAEACRYPFQNGLCKGSERERERGEDTRKRGEGRA